MSKGIRDHYQGCALPGILLLGLLLICPTRVARGLEAPVAQINAVAAGGAVGVTLGWPQVAGADRYSIYGRSEEGGPGLLLARVGATQYQHVESMGRRFYYVVAEDTTEGVPSQSAPTPVHDAAEVISLFSDAYADVPVNTWSAPWDQADVEDVLIAGDAVKLYTSLGFAGIEFSTPTIDATHMTHLHMDIWTPDPTAAPALFHIKLVDFGANGVYGGGDDVEDELDFDESSIPPLRTAHWVSFLLPLADFSALTTTAHLAQLLISGDPDSVFVDNVYLWRDGNWTEPTEPLSPAPTPVHVPDRVISLFSDAYANVLVDSWSAPWDQADVEEVLVAGNAVKRYTNLGYAGIEFVSQTIDATSMTDLHVDLWTAESVSYPATFRIKLVDFGANGVWDGGGDDVEHEVALDATTTPPLQRIHWLSLDLPLSRFSGLVTRGHLAQIVISGDLPTIYLDNLYLYNHCTPWVPATSTPPAAWGDDNPPARTEWSLVWDDEFDGPAGQAPDPGKWDHDLGTSWGNAQLEFDTDRPQNASLDGNGRLRIVARREDYQGCQYTSARIVTRNRYEPTYGRMEARIKLPVGQGIWPAFWILGANVDEVSWPQCGEIDIMETRGQQPDINHGTVHGPGYAGGGAFTNAFTLPGAGFHEDFHVFGIEWGVDAIHWTVDGINYGTATPADLSGSWVFNHPFYLILNVAVGGSFVGPPDECTIFPQTMLVDWVRVYQEVP